MVAKLRHLYEIIAGAILSFFGFTGCDAIEDIVYPKAEYGMPHAKYQIQGTVTAEETGSPIQGVRVKYSHLDYVDDDGNKHFTEMCGDNILTDKDGKVDITDTAFASGQDEIEISLEDIDGAENGGNFETMILHNEDLQIEFVKDNGGRWHIGDYTINFAAKMKQAENLEK